MANLAALYIGRIDHRRVIADAEAGSDRKCAARHDAWQRRAHVDPVDEVLEIDCVARIRVDILRLVAHHAEVDAAPRSAVCGKLLVALVATGSFDYVARVRHLGAVGYEVERRAGVVRRQTVCGQVARSVNAYGVSCRRIESRGTWVLNTY